MAMRSGDVPPAEADRIQLAIAQSLLGDGLPVWAIQELAAFGQWETFGEEEVILHQNDEDSNLLILATGKAEVNTFANEPLYYLTAHMVFGEVALIDEKPRSATVKAVETCEVVTLSAPDLRNFIFSQPEVGVLLLRNLARLLCSRIRAGNQQLAALLTLEELREGKV